MLNNLTAAQLSMGSSYYLVGQETAGVPFYDVDTSVTTTNVATVNSGEYDAWFAYPPTKGAGHTYGPVSFTYSTAVPQPCAKAADMEADRRATCPRRSARSIAAAVWPWPPE